MPPSVIDKQNAEFWNIPKERAMLALLTRKMRGLKGRLKSKLDGAVQQYKQAKTFRRTVAPYPATIYLAVNTRCGFACKMCDVGMDQYDTQFYKIMSLSKDKPRERLAIDRLKTLVDEVKDFKPMIAMYLLLTKTGGV